jgi:hypothetical protein
VLPPAQYSPATQASHTVADVLVPATVSLVPAEQLPCGWQTNSLAPWVKVPAEHAVHARSLAALGSVLT